MKYKRCHGALEKTATPYSRPIPKEVLQAFAKHEAERKSYESNHGAVKEIISAEFDDWRFVATGSTLHYAKNWKVFTDFLGPYLAGCLGKEWGERQVKLPLDDQHPIVQWHTLLGLSQQGAKPDNRGLYGTRIGAGNAWFRLAYDLYLIEHNAELKRRLIKRLRDPSHFQGARFEAAVAAMMLAAGYDLNFADEKGPGRHPEFYATHRETGQVLAVEAKSRHRPGILGFQAQSPAPEHPSSFDIDRLLLSAAEKDTRDPLLAFVELNSPVLLDIQSPTAIYNELDASWQKVQRRPWESGFPCAGVVFYNDIAPWYLREPLPKDRNSVWALALWPTTSRHAFDAKPLLNRIAQGCIQRSNIPLHFPERR